MFIHFLNYRTASNLDGNAESNEEIETDSEMLRLLTAGTERGDEFEDLDDDNDSLDNDASVDGDRNQIVTHQESEHSDSDLEGETSQILETERWQCIEEFETEEEVDTFFNNDGGFSIRTSVQLNKGLKRMYRCNKAKKTNQQCACRYYTLTGFKKDNSTATDDDQNDDVELQCAGTAQDDEIPPEDPNNKDSGPFQLFFNHLSHTCGAIEHTSTRVSHKVKEKILSLHKQGYHQPKQICLEMGVSEDITDDELPTLRQVRYVLRHLKDKTYGKGPLTMRQLSEFAEARKIIPDDPDETFVVMFERSLPSLPPDNPGVFYRLFLSTKRLLIESAGAINIHADATKKITTDGNPLLVIGATDAAKKFHLIGVTISSHETSDAYEMSFNAVQKGVMDVTGKPFKPEVLVADGDRAIHNGCRKSFGNQGFPIVMCYAHVIRNVTTKYKFNDKKKNKDQLVEDLRILHNSSNERMFRHGCELFVAKWKDAEPHVVDSVNKSFFEQNNTWYIGFRFRTPVTDNALENFNGDIKKYQTNHLKKPLKEFLPYSMKMIRQRSKEYLSIPKPRFQSKVEFTDAILLAGYAMDRNHVYRINREEGIIQMYLFSSEANELANRAITFDDVNHFETAVFVSFDDFVKNAFRVWCITFPTKKNDWLQKTTCTCPAFDEKYVCKHIAFLGYLYKMAMPPVPEVADVPNVPNVPEDEPNYDDMPLLPAKTKTTGRPKRAGPALQKE